MIYEVVAEDFLPEFEKQVAIRINKGYQLVGGVSVSYTAAKTLYAQALVKINQ